MAIRGVHRLTGLGRERKITELTHYLLTRLFHLACKNLI